MNLSTANIIDLSVLAFIVLNVIVGAIKGAFKSFIGLAVLAGSVFIGYYFSPMLAPKLVDWIYPKISDKLLGIASEKLGMAESLISAETLESTIKPVLQKPARIVLWVIIALVAFFILDIIANIINKAIKKSDTIKGANSGLGAILSLVMSVAICFALVFASAHLGLSDYLAEKADGSIAYTFIEGFVPDEVKKDSGIINIPVIGEINIAELILNGKAE